MADSSESFAHFRLNFEQQRKRAKDLLKAARSGDPKALGRFKSPPRLAEAQYLIAQTHGRPKRTITHLGRAVLKGDVDFLSLRPPSRWVGGVQLGPGLTDWRWNEGARSVVRR